MQTVFGSNVLRRHQRRQLKSHVRDLNETSSYFHSLKRFLSLAQPGTLDYYLNLRMTYPMGLIHYLFHLNSFKLWWNQQNASFIYVLFKCISFIYLHTFMEYRLFTCSIVFVKLAISLGCAYFSMAVYHQWHHLNQYMHLQWAQHVLLNM